MIRYYKATDDNNRVRIVREGAPADSYEGKPASTLLYSSCRADKEEDDESFDPGYHIVVEEWAAIGWTITEISLEEVEEEVLLEMI